jgi:TP901 family phage tail tape measure protein
MARGLNTANKSAISFLESMKLIMYKFSTWLLMGNLFMGFYHQIGAGIAFIKDLDSAFTNLKKVTNDTKEVYANFAKEASDIGRQLAKTTIEVVDATTAFSKMGFTLNEAKELAQTALITSNVGDIGVEQSTEFLISSLKAYNITAQESIKITDILNSVQNQHATTVEVLGEGLKRTANSMQLAGASIEQTVAMITAVQAVSQRGGEVIGNALRTVSFRLRSIDEESGELLPSLEGDLNRVGVKLKSVDGGFRNVYEVLKDLSSVWKTLDSFTQADLLEKIAGKRQGEILATLLTNFAESELALKHATESFGSAAQENEVYMQSVEAKIQQFQVSLENLYQTFMNSSSLVGFVNIGQGLINLLTGMTNSIGGFNTLLLTSGSVVLLVSSKFRTFMSTLDTKVLNLFGISITGLYRKLIVLTGGATTARFAISALYGAMTFGIGIISGFAIEGVIKLITKMGETAREQKEYFDQLSSSAKNLSSEISSNEELIGTYKELSSKMNLATKEKTKLTDITNKLAQIMPSAVEQYDLEGNAISLSSKELERYVELKKEELDLKRRGLETEFYSNFDKEVKNLKSDRDRLEEITQMISSAQEQIKTLTSSSDYEDSYFKKDMVKFAKERIAGLSIEQQKLIGTMGELNSKVKSQAESFLLLSENLKGLGKTEIDKIINVLFDSIDKVDDTSIKSFLQTVAGSKDASEAIKNINNQLEEYKKGNVSAANAQKNVNEQLNNLRNILIGLNIDPTMIELFIQSFVPEPIQSVNKETDLFKSSCIDLQQVLSDTSSNLQNLNKALKEYSETGKFSLATILDLSGTYPQLLGFLEDEEGLRKELISIIKDEENTQKTSYANMLIQSENFFNAKILGNTQLVESINNQYNELFKQLGVAYEFDLGNFKSLTKAKSETESVLINELAWKWSNYYDVASGSLTSLYAEDLMQSQEYAGTEIGRQLEASINPFKNLYNEYKNMSKRFEDIAISTSGIDFSGINLAGGDSKSGGSSADKAVDQWKSAFDQINQEYLESRNLWSRKVDLGITKGLEILSEQLKIEEDKLNKIFDNRSKLTKNLLDQQQKLSESSEGTEEYSSILANIDKINIELANWNQYEEEQLQVVQKIKSEYESINKTISKLNSITDNVINSIKDYGKDLRTQFINVIDSLQLNKIFGNNLFGKSSDFVSTLRDSLKTAMLTATNLFQREIPEAVAAKLTFITDAKSMKDIENAKAILDEMYSDNRQIRLTMEDYNISSKLLEVKKLLTEINQMEIDYNKSVKEQNDEISDYQDQIDAINEEEKVEEKVKQIEDAKLKIKEQEIALQEKKNDLLKIEADILDVMKDKRFELITTEGERILTFDQSKVNDLEEDRKSAQEAIDDANKSLIDAEQDYHNLKKDLARQEEIEELEALKSKAEKRIKKITENYEEEQGLWLDQHKDELNASEIMNSETDKLFSDGLESKLGIYRTYLEEQRDLYQIQVDDALKAAKAVSQVKSVQQLVAIDFKELPKSKLQSEQTDKTQSPNQTQVQTDLEIQTEEEKQKSILEIIISSAKLKLEQIIKSQQEIANNFIEYWKTSRELEVTKFDDINKINTEGYNNLLKLYVNYMDEQRTMWKQATKDAYDAGKAIADAFSAGKSGGGGYSAPSFSPMNYNQLSYIPTVSTSNIIQNAVTVILNPTASNAVMSAISSYLPSTIRSNS